MARQSLEQEVEQQLYQRKVSVAQVMSDPALLREVSKDALGESDASLTKEGIAKVQGALQRHAGRFGAANAPRPVVKPPKQRGAPIKDPAAYDQAKSAGALYKELTAAQGFAEANSRLQLAMKRGDVGEIKKAEAETHYALREAFRERRGTDPLATRDSRLAKEWEIIDKRLARTLQSQGLLKKLRAAEQRLDAPATQAGPVSSPLKETGPVSKRRRTRADKLREKLEYHGVPVAPDADTDTVEKTYARFKSSIADRRSKRVRGYVSGLGTGTGVALAARPGALGAFIGTYRLLNRETRIVLAVALIVGLIFIPVGIFKFAGWSIAAAVMVAISSMYFVLLNAFKAVASILVTAINAVYSAFAGVIVRATELILDLFGTPKPACTLGDGSTIAADITSFCSGRRILSQGFIPASQLHAIDVTLLDPNKLKPNITSESLVDWAARSFGLHLDLGGFMYRVFLGEKFQEFVRTGNIYAVTAIFAVPTVLIGWVLWSKLVRPSLRVAGVVA